MRHKIIPYNPILKQRANELRKDSTLTEIMMWEELKKKKLLGYDFDRQKPIDNYIVDFYCKELKLAIEIDGESHYGKEEKDAYRDKRLNAFGVNVLRFDDMDVRYNLDKVMAVIEQWVEEKVNKHKL
jgi:very-short-patch-repair endonuclease